MKLPGLIKLFCYGLELLVGLNEGFQFCSFPAKLSRALIVFTDLGEFLLNFLELRFNSS